MTEVAIPPKPKKNKKNPALDRLKKVRAVESKSQLVSEYRADYHPEDEKQRKRLPPFLNSLIRAAIIGTASLVGFCAISAVSGLAYFFAISGAAMFHMQSPFLIQFFSILIAAVIFVDYAATWAYATYSIGKDFADAKFPARNESKAKRGRRKLDKKLREEQFKYEYDRDAKNKAWSIALNIITYTLGIPACAIIGLGGYLGIMTISPVLQPFAIICSFCMFVSFAAFYLPVAAQNMQNIFGRMIGKKERVLKDQFEHRKAEIEQEEQAKKDAAAAADAAPLSTKKSIKRRLIQGLTVFLMLGVAFGFTAFKAFSTIHVSALLGITSASAVMAITIASSIMICFLTLFTSSTKIYKEGMNLANRKANRSEKYVDTPFIPSRYKATKLSKILKGVGVVFTVIGAILNAMGSAMGLLHFGFTAPLIIGAALLAICRFAEFYIYLGPYIKRNISDLSYSVQAGELTEDALKAKREAEAAVSSNSSSSPQQGGTPLEDIPEDDSESSEELAKSDEKPMDKNHSAHSTISPNTHPGFDNTKTPQKREEDNLPSHDSTSSYSYNYSLT